MRIVIDLQGAQTESRFRGIGRYSLSLAKSMVRNRGDHEIIIALSDFFPDTIESIRAEFHGLISQENIRVWSAPGPVRECEPGNRWRREAAELIREAFLASLQPDVVHICSLFEGYGDDAATSIGRFDKKTPVCVTLYDLIPLLNPDQYLKSNPTGEQHYLGKIDHLRRASLLLAISEYTRQEGIDALGCQAESVINISAAVDSCFRQMSVAEMADSPALLHKYGISRSIVLYTGGADERKNLPRLIRAYARLDKHLRAGHQLVFVGAMLNVNSQHLSREARSAGLRPDELIFTGYITDKEIVQLYNLCRLYVFPSWYEGFGLPVLEAMSCGAPVVGANTTSLPEVFGDTAAMFDPFSEQAMAEKIYTALTDEDFRHTSVKQGLKQVKNFSWDKSAKIAISAFEKIVGKNLSPSLRIPAVHRLVKNVAEALPANISKQDLVSLSIHISQNHPQVGLRQLFVDISELSQRDAATGVQRVTRSVLMELLNRPPAGCRVEPVYATPQSNGYFYAKKYTANLLGLSEREASDEPLILKHGDIFLGLDLQHHVVIAQDHYFEYLRGKGVFQCFVVYDLLPITLDKYFAEGSSALHTQWLQVVSRSDAFLCISKTVANELKNWVAKYCYERKGKVDIFYFHLGADIKNAVPPEGLSPYTEQILTSLQSVYTFLMVGTLEPRKGHRQVLSAFEKLWVKGEPVNLVLVGKQGWAVDDLIEDIQKHPQLNKRLFWLNNVSDEYLEKIYTSSTCLIAASEGEGFGLPLIEAAQYKLPVIARDIPVFREVAGQHAYFFSGNDRKELSDEIEAWISLYQKHKHPVSDDMPWITWQQSTDNLMEVILRRVNTAPVKCLLVDVSELIQQDAGTGIQRVVRVFLQELLVDSPDGWCVEPVYATASQGYRYARSFTSAFMDCPAVASLKDEPIEYRPGDIFLGLDLPPQVVAARQDFYQQMRRHGVTVKFVVYDILPVLLPQYFHKMVAEVFRRWLEVVAESDGAFCISQAVADELSVWLKDHGPQRLRPFDISWFHLGTDNEVFKSSRGLPADAASVLVKIRNRSSFLLVGTIEPRKGHAQVLSAFEQLWAAGKDVNLVIVGKQGWMVEGIIDKIRRSPELDKRLFWLQGISDEYLENIYEASTCLIAASEGEGFGLPLIEAARHRLSIIARDIPVFREVAGSHAFYFGGDSPFVIVDAVKDWLVLYKMDRHPHSDNIPWLTWKQSAKQFKNVLNSSDKCITL